MTLKSMMLAAAATAVSGCALLEPHETAAVATAAPESAPAAAPLQQVSLRPARSLKSSQPLGLAPCPKGVFQSNSCWRKGDQHYVFDDPAPDGLETSPLSGPAPTLVRD